MKSCPHPVTAPNRGAVALRAVNRGARECDLLYEAAIRMKRNIVLTCLALAVLGSSHAAEPANPQEQQLIAAIKELQAQQALIAENQAKIEAKLATVAEAVRIARIYSSRGGS